MGSASQCDESPTCSAVTLHLGVLLPVSGDWPEGRTFIGAVQVALQDIRDAGIFGSQTLEALWEDDGCSPVKSSRGLSQLISVVEQKRGKLAGLIGPACSAGCETAGFMAGELNLIDISYSCASATLVDEVKFPTVRPHP